MDEIVQSYATGKRFMGSVLVARDKDVLFSKSYGSANLEWNIPNSPATKFRLGSVTKQFTAASILLLEERGKLKVDDHVKQYMPDAPAAWDEITIFNVLTHTAGIPNFTSFPEYPKLEPFPTPADKLVALFRDKPLDFKPGEKWSYSNSGYVLLGYLIEKISGGSYEKFVQENIFDPLGMKDSGYDSNSAIIEHRAAGYEATPKGPQNAGFIHMSIPHAAGALYSTTEDLLRWERGLFGGKVISAASLQKMTKPFKDDYAFGLQVQTVGGHKIIQHGGGIEGFNTNLAYYPDDKLTVVVLSNIAPAPAIGDISAKLAAIAHGDKIRMTSEKKEITVPADALAKYVGTYEMRPGINMWITLSGSQLMTQMSGQGKLPIFAESETMFFPKVVDADIEFVMDPAGKVTALILHQGGRDQKAQRISDQVTERKDVTVARAILADYAGTYQLRSGFDLVIALEGDQLAMTPTGQQKSTLFAESETKFFLKTIDVQVEFVKGPEGRVTHLMFHQGPAEIKAPRQ
ncbi:MAG TPA: serine hydrolase [Bryobacteraceae bacterium]|nr:serine hydrolase [Bryobacteraceae bacterium]